jgi:hypothetical protein
MLQNIVSNSRSLRFAQAQLEIQRLAEACIKETGLVGRDDDKLTPFDKVTLAVLGGETEVGYSERCRNLVRLLPFNPSVSRNSPSCPSFE